MCVARVACGASSYHGPASTESLVLMGSARELATSFALLMHATMFGFTVLSGVFFMLSEGWALTTLVKASRKVSNE